MQSRHRSQLVAVLGLLICLAAAVPALAYGPNLLVNPGFNTDLAGWEFTNAFWAPSDAGGAITSGSANPNLIRQCVPVVGGMSYALAASFWIPSATATPGVQLEFLAAFYSGAACQAQGFLSPVFHPLPAFDSWKTLTRDRWNFVAGTVVAPASALSAIIQIGVASADWEAENFRADSVYFGTGTCAPTAKQLCLNRGRFKVEARWKAKLGSGIEDGDGAAVPFADESGSFWFFNPTNLELDVKVLDGCPLNNRYWVFAAGLTNVNVVLTVTDTQTGAEKVYVNPKDHVFETITDTEAFATCP